MSSIRTVKNSKYWIAVYRDTLGRQHNKSTKIPIGGDGSTQRERADNRREALRISQQLEALERGHPTEAHMRRVLAEIAERVNDERMEFAQTENYLNAWLDRTKNTKSYRTWLRYQKSVKDFLEGLGSRKLAPLSSIGPIDIQRFIDRQVKAGLSATTIKNNTKTLNIPLNQALRQGLILTNPVPVAELPQGAQESRKDFTWDQVKALIKEAKGEWQTLIYIGVFTGARLGDCVSLKWKNVDLPDRAITYTPSKTQRTGKVIKLPMHTMLEAHLMALPTTDDPEAWLCPSLNQYRIPGRSGLSRQFQEIMHRAGIDQETGKKKEGAGRVFRKYGFHSLRHTFNSVLANKGVGLDIRKALTGHASGQMNEQYTHREFETLRQAVEQIPEIES